MVCRTCRAVFYDGVLVLENEADEFINLNGPTLTNANVITALKAKNEAASSRLERRKSTIDSRTRSLKAAKKYKKNT